MAEKIKRVKASTIPTATSIEGFNALGIRKNADNTIDNVQVPMSLLKGNVGDKGDKGDTGEKGDPNSLAIGTVQKGEMAGANITGTAPNQILSLTLPEGDKGETGDKGDTGEKGDKGDQGLKGDTGEKGDKGDKGNTGDAFTYGMFTSEQLATLKGDKGDKGDKGNPFIYSDFTQEQLVLLVGEKGDKGDQGLKGDKGEKGDQGIQGEQGEQGDQGEQGIQGIQGEQGTKGEKGDKGDKGDTGIGLPIGGVTGQQLMKKSSVDYDFEWQTPAGAGDMLKSEYDSDGDGIVDNAEKVNGFTVGTNVPANAKFTDTTYSEITEAEINTGTASTLRTMTARRVTFILSKVSTLISNAISALTKSDVGLSNLDNLQQATKVEFNEHNVDAAKHITASERTAWNAKGSSNLSLGPTSGTAYRGDYGNIAYTHSQSTHAPTNAQKNSDITKAEIEAKLTGAITSHTHSAYVPTSRKVAGKALTGDITLAKGDVGLGNVDNTSDEDKPVSTAQAAAIALKIDASKFQVVTELPASPVTGVFYFVKD